MKYLIIGASAAGISAAKKLYKLDNEAEITIISKDKVIYSRCMLHHFISDERNLEELRFIHQDFFTTNNLNWIKGQEVISINSTEKYISTVDGSTYTYDKLLLATGSKPFFPPITNLKQGEEIFGLRTLEDAQAIKKLAQNINSAVVIGAGLVGIDAAIGLHRLGVKVSIVEMDDRILPSQLDKRAAAKYETRFEDAGIEIVTEARANEVLLDARYHVRGLKLANERVLEADLIIVAAGVRPNIGLIEDTGIEIDQGIIVDQYQQTTVPDIYAAGDVCQSKELFTKELTLTPIWPVAVKQGEVAACNMAGSSQKLTDNFAYQNSMCFLGLSTINYGLVEAVDEEYEVRIREDKSNYQKLILKDNKLRGAIFQGEIAGSGVYGKLIKEEIDLSNKLNNLFNLTYADFFHEKADGSFSY